MEPMNVISVALCIAYDLMFELDDEEDVTAQVIEFQRCRTQIVKVVGYAERVVSAMAESTFKGHFRLTRSTFMSLQERLEPLLICNNGMRTTVI